MDKIEPGARRRWGRGAVLIATGTVAGGALAWTMTAGAATTPSPTGSYAASPAPSAGPGETTSRRLGERLLTGDTATKVREAALAKYPGASVLRVETDSDGVYEAHLRTASGQPVTVEVGQDFTVTGEEATPAGRGGDCGPGGGPGGGWGFGDRARGQGGSPSDPGGSTGSGSPAGYIG